MDQQLSTLRIQRGYFKTRLTNFKKYIEKININDFDDITIAQLETRLLKIEPLIDEFNKVHLEIKTLDNNDSEELEDDLESEIFENSYFDSIARVKCIILNVRRSDKCSVNVSLVTNNSLTQVTKDLSDIFSPEDESDSVVFKPNKTLESLNVEQQEETFKIKLQEEQYYAVFYTANWYIGRIISISIERVKVKFLEDELEDTSLDHKLSYEQDADLAIQEVLKSLDIILSMYHSELSPVGIEIAMELILRVKQKSLSKVKNSLYRQDNGTVDIGNKEATEELRENQVGTNRPAILTQGAQVGTTARFLPKGHTSRGRQQNMPVVNEAINLMKSIQSRKMQDRDEFSAFGEQNAINSILFAAEMGRFDNPLPPLFHHNPTAIYNTNLPLNIPPQFPPYCSPSPPIPASTNCLGGTTYVYSKFPSVQSEQPYGEVL
ncbi:hypothetical protein RN001_005349 [Aquatica leii]|uniref:Uncharacterized protein n=1 Tax=Aquatica leii TaxID=1421715 RepID=A0AAN7SS18_9COLE|nr:hypothetical protein RN001_005349 [Aquatica leii]